VSVPASRIALFGINEAGRLRIMTPATASELGIGAYDPDAQIVGSAPPRRAATLFSCVPALSCRREDGGADESFDLARGGPIGTGWRGAEPDGSGGTFRWSVNPTSVVRVDLAAERDLVVEFKVLYWLDASVLDSLRLTVNGVGIPLSVAPASPSGRLYRAILPRSVLTIQPSTMRVVFNVDHLVPVPDDPQVKLGFALNWLRIRPR
jgi:hypothetical protein